MEQLKSEFNLRFTEVNDPHLAFTLLCKVRQVKHDSVQVYAERLIPSQMMLLQK